MAVLVAQSSYGRLPIDGIRCDANEGAVEHVHALAADLRSRTTVAVPANIGIPQGGGCLYWVHTHDGRGYIHIESPVKRAFTLGEFFDIWGPQT